MRAAAAALVLSGASAISMKEIDDVIKAGPFKDDFDQIKSMYKVPDWYVDGKFGFYTHWGVYSVPAFGSEWYPRNMYKKGTKENLHQVATYGNLSVTDGYKEFIPEFTGEHFNATEWMGIFERAGAKFAGPVGEHHDGFAMYNCSISEYNSVKMGPMRDVAGELRDAAAKLADMRLVVSSHRAWHSAFYDGGRSDPASDVYQCECDGGGKAAHDPAYCTLYCPANTDEKVPTDGFMQDWLLRTCEIIDLYSNDVMYFDWWIGVAAVWKPYVAKMAAFYYNRMHQAGKMGVINTKGTTMPTGTDVLDFERGQACTVQRGFWQTDTSISDRSWGYVTGDSYKSAPSILGNLIDIVAKNGALLMNVGPAPNGTIPAAAVRTFVAVGDWLAASGESVYGTRPYHVFGEGPVLMGCGSFASEETVFGPADFRFTSKGNSTVYAIAMGHRGGEAVVKSLGRSRAASGTPSSVEVLGFGPQKYSIQEDGLHVEVPAAAAKHGPPVIAVRGLTDAQWDGVVRQGYGDGMLDLAAASADAFTGGAGLDIAPDGAVVNGSKTVVKGLQAGSASWVARVRAAASFKVAVVASAPACAGNVTVRSSGSTVVVAVSQTQPNEFRTFAAAGLLQVPAGDVTVTASAATHPAPPAPLPPRGGNWIVEPGFNYFKSCPVDNSTWYDFGVEKSGEGCLAACKAFAECRSFTWHDPSLGPPWGGKCLGRTDNYYQDPKEAAHTSGRVNTTTLSEQCSHSTTLQVAGVVLSL